MRIPLRNPWTLMTMRGKVTLVIGAAITALAILLGQRDALLLGLFVLLVPLVSAVAVDRTRLRLSCERTVTPSRTPIGDSVTSTLALNRHGNLPAGMLRFEDRIPESLGERPRFTIQNIAPEWERKVTYTMSGSQRGRFRIGPLLVRVSDPFGMASLDRSFTATSELMVTPKVYPLETSTSSGGSGNTGEARPQRLGLSGQDDVLVREYNRGDDVRRVHWRSTARHGQLMVRREEQAWDPSAMVLVDSRADAHRGSGPTSSFEWAVSMGASLTMHLLGQGYLIQLVGADGPLIDPELGDLGSLTSSREAMTQLTDIKLSDAEHFSGAVEGTLRTAASQMMVAVMGRLDPGDVAQLLQMQRNRAYALVWVLDVDEWDDATGSTAAGDEAAAPVVSTPEAREAHEQAVQMLQDSGWRVIRVGRQTSVSDAWMMMQRWGGTS